MIECKSEKEKYCCKTEIGGFTIQSDVTADKGGQENGIRHMIFWRLLLLHV
jgi:hypothetical protein